MGKNDQDIKEALEGLDEDKRKILMRLAKGSAFSAPIIVAFLMQGLSIRPAHAFAGSSSNKTQ